MIKVELLNHMGDDLTVVNAARVSFAKESLEFSDQDARLIRYLARNGHWSPFAHCILQFRITAPIFVVRQLFQHQVGLAVNEVSRRYVDDEPEFYEPDVWRSRAKDKKQGSAEPIGDQRQRTSDAILSYANDAARRSYHELLMHGVAPEQARMVLPQAMMTTWWWTGSLYAFARICRERLAEDAQAETREGAEQIGNYCAELFPASWLALMNQGVE